MEESGLLASSQGFFYTSQGHLHRSSTAHSRLGPLWLIINQENASQTYLQPSPNKVPSSQMTPVCVKLTKTNQGDLKTQRHCQIVVRLVQPSATHPGQMGLGQCAPPEQLILWWENLTQKVTCGVWANKGPKPRCHLQISVFIQLSDSWHSWEDGWVPSKPDQTGKGYPQPSRLCFVGWNYVINGYISSKTGWTSFMLGDSRFSALSLVIKPPRKMIKIS